MNNRNDFQIFGIQGYTVMSNYHLRDKNLSLKAKGLLSIMLSLPKEWDYSINGLVQLSNDGRDAVKSALYELKQTQYVSINECRDLNGHFKYNYTVYYLPYPKWLEINKFTEDGFTTTVKPSTENPQEINTNNKKDKLDKTPIQLDDIIEHTIFTKELIKRNYIEEDFNSSFLFDQLYEKLIKEIDFKDLMMITSYVLTRIKQNNYKDEFDNPITNKYGYLKNALESNISKFQNMPDSIFDF